MHKGSEGATRGVLQESCSSIKKVFAGLQACNFVKSRLKHWKIFKNTYFEEKLQNTRFSFQLKILIIYHSWFLTDQGLYFTKIEKVKETFLFCLFTGV